MLEKLIALGLTKELAEKVETEYKTELDGQYVPKDRFNEVVTERNNLRKEVTERDTQLETLKSAAGSTEDLKQQIAQMQTDIAEREKQFATELKAVRRDNLDERLLNEAKAINPVAVKPFLVEVDPAIDDETYTTMRKQQIEAIKAGEGTKFLFTADTQTPPPQGWKPGEVPDQSQTGQLAGSNPFAKDSYDEKAIMEMYKTSPDIARAMMKAAGMKVF